jgi:hypothetical protein
MTVAADEFDSPDDNTAVDDDKKGTVDNVHSSSERPTGTSDMGVIATPDTEDADDHTDDENPNKREARYRLQLRDTEAERDQLRSTVAALQIAEVERLAGKSIQRPSALWSADVELTSLLDDVGRVDPVKVDAATQQAQKTLGLAPTRPAGYVRGEGQVVGQPTAGNAWEGAFKR